MDKSKHLYIWELAALISLCVCLLTGLWAQGRQSRVADSLVRLHVLAVSDEPYEQAVKLRVRDAVLQYLAPKLSAIESADRAETVLSDSLDAIRSLKPSYIFLCYGLNDTGVGYWKTGKEYAAELKTRVK